jgi:hypothetical protein
MTSSALTMSGVEIVHSELSEYALGGFLAYGFYKTIFIDKYVGFIYEFSYSTTPSTSLSDVSLSSLSECTKTTSNRSKNDADTWEKCEKCLAKRTSNRRCTKHFDFWENDSGCSSVFYTTNGNAYQYSIHHESSHDGSSEDSGS